MLLTIDQLLNIPGTEESFNGTIDLSHIERHGESLFPEILAVSGKIVNRAGVVTLRYQISGGVPYLCDRCLMQSKLTLSNEFCHTIVRTLEDEELEDVYLVCADGRLLLDEVVSSDLLLMMPAQLLCKADCKGLCTKCGASQNEGPCDCPKTEIDPRLLKLRELLN